MTHEEPVSFTSDSLRLEGRLAAPAGATRALVLCHPHPQYGGSMDNNVIDALVEHLARRAVATLRFNFRGVGASQGSYDNGVGEGADARAALELLRDRTAVEGVVLAGYSFGAMVALQVGHDHPAVAALVAVAPPLAFFDLGFLAACRKPKLLLAGDRDTYCPSAVFHRAADSLVSPTTATTIAGADHFFGGHEDELGAVVAAFVCGEMA